MLQIRLDAPKLLLIWDCSKQLQPTWPQTKSTTGCLLLSKPHGGQHMPRSRSPKPSEHQLQALLGIPAKLLLPLLEQRLRESDQHVPLPTAAWDWKPRKKMQPTTTRLANSRLLPLAKFSRPRPSSSARAATFTKRYCLLQPTIQELALKEPWKLLLLLCPSSPLPTWWHELEWYYARDSQNWKMNKN